MVGAGVGFVTELEQQQWRAENQSADRLHIRGGIWFASAPKSLCTPKGSRKLVCHRKSMKLFKSATSWRLPIDYDFVDYGLADGF
jgi:hypothetical protein